MKKCNKCSEYKQISEFPVDPRNSDGAQGICKECKNTINEARRITNMNKPILVLDKTCNECSTIKPSSEFFREAGNKDGLGSVCKVCKKARTYKWRAENKEAYNASARAWGKKNPEKRYGSEIKRRYGCTLEQYNSMLIKQSGQCAICDTLHNPAEKKGRLYVDHCHKTSKVRELLCGDCNSALGYFKDNTEVMNEAIAYIILHRSKS